MTNPAADIAPDDLVAVELFTNALDTIAKEMGLVLMRTSGSPIICETTDFATFLADAQGGILTFGGYAPLHFGPSRQTIRYIREVVPEQTFRAGDAFLSNDPYTTGQGHDPDVCIVRPIIVDGAVVAWAGALAHTFDIGGITPGGFAPMATDCYQEGLALPGIKFVSEGRIVDDVERLIRANVRVPSLVINDLRCLVAACNAAEKLICELASSMGTDQMAQTMALCQQLSHAGMRARIAALPDGVWEADEFVEHNGHRNAFFRIHCRAEVCGDRLTLDFSGSDPQTEGGVNCSMPTTIGSALVPVVMSLAPDIPINEGLASAIEILAPPGMICSAVPPAPVSIGHMEAGMHVTKGVTRLLARMQQLSDDTYVSEHAMATWHDCYPAAVLYAKAEDGQLVPFLDTHASAGGGGAQLIQDGLDCAGPLTGTGNSIPDVEVNEFAYPILYLWRRLNTDSGGAGRHRGGLGIDIASTPWRTPGGQLQVFVSCWQVPPPGLGGGFPGSSSGFEVIRAEYDRAAFESRRLPATLDDLSGTVEALQSKQYEISVGPGDVIRMRCGGGAGVGDPLGREPAAVAADVRDHAVSIEAAEAEYGVVLDPDGQPDAVATAARRSQILDHRKRWALSPDATQLVHSSSAWKRMAVAGGWVQPHAAVTIVERADPDSGHLIAVDVIVAEG
jgi:N-methylhydantoinase B